MRPLPAPTADTPSFEGLRDALLRLDATTRPDWGKLDAQGMLEHCSRFVDLYLGRVPVSGAIRFAARWMGPLFLRRMVAKSPLDTPRNMRTLGALQPEAVDAETFADALARFRSGLDEIEALEGEMDHVLYGPTDAASIKTLVRHHAAHHFHQFGLLEAS